MANIGESSFLRYFFVTFPLLFRYFSLLSGVPPIVSSSLLFRQGIVGPFAPHQSGHLVQIKLRSQCPL